MSVTIHHGDCLDVLKTLPDASVHCCVTSPPYFRLRDYSIDGQIGLEETPCDYVARLVDVFREVRRVLRDDGTLWLNIGDSYATKPNGSIGTSGLEGSVTPHAEVRRLRSLRSVGVYDGIKSKDLIGIPWMLAFALRADGWYLRQDIIWSKPNPMPESVRDRCTKAHEYIFLLSKSDKYFFDSEAIKEPAAASTIERSKYGYKHAFKGQFIGSPKDDRHQNGKKYDIGAFANEKRNRRSVWTVATQPYKGAHFATFPPALIEPCIASGCPVGGTVLDPFGGAGTVGLVAERLGIDSVLIELNAEYVELARDRIASDKGSSLKRQIVKNPTSPQFSLFGAAP